MTIRIVRLGQPRASDEGTRLGTVRRPPRGVRKQDFARLDWYDVWFPVLAPSVPTDPTIARTPSPSTNFLVYSTVLGGANASSSDTSVTWRPLMPPDALIFLR